MKSIIRNPKGFTLVELLIALVIFAVGILGFATMQITSIKGNSKGRLISEASNVAADRIETFMSLDYGDSLLSDGSGTNAGVAGLEDLPPNNTDGSATSSDGNYQIYWNVADDHPVTGVKTINVFVFPPGNNARFVEMSIEKADLF